MNHFSESDIKLHLLHEKRYNRTFTKGHITKVYSIKGVDLKICLGFLLGKESPDSKNSVCFENRRVRQF